MSKKPKSGRIGLGAAAQFGGLVVQQVLKYLANIVIARGLGAAVLGIYQLSLTAWIAVQRSFCGGLERAIMRFVPHHVARDEETRASSAIRLGMQSALVGGLVLGGGVYLCSDFMAVRILHQPQAAPVLKVLGIALPFAALHYTVWALGRSLNSVCYVLFQFVLVPLSFLLFIVGMTGYWSDAGAAGVAWARLLSFAVAGIPLIFYYFSLRRPLPAPSPTFDSRPMFRFMGLTMLLSLAEFFSRNVDIFLLGRLGSAAEVGYYTMASRTATLCTMVIVSFNAFFSPTISAMYAEDRSEEMRQLFARACSWVLLVGAPLVAFLISNAPDILVLFGRDFQAAVPALYILAGAQLVNLGTGLVAAFLLMADREILILVLNIVALGANVVLCRLLIPEYGLVGAAIGLATAIVFLNLASMAYGSVLFGLNPVTATSAKALAAGIAAGVVNGVILQPLVPGGIVGLAVGIGTIGLVYTGVVFLLGGRHELKEALESLRRGLENRG